MGATPRARAAVARRCRRRCRSTTSTRSIDGLTALAARHRVHVAGGNLTRSPGPLDRRRHGHRHREAAPRADARRRAARRRALRDRVGRRAPPPGCGLLAGGRAGAAGRRTWAGVRRALPAPGAAGPHRLARSARNRAATACMDLERRAGRRRPPGRRGERRRRDRRRRRAADRSGRARAGSRRTARDAAVEAAAGGDDYELLVAVRPRAARPAGGRPPARRRAAHANRRAAPTDRRSRCVARPRAPSWTCRCRPRGSATSDDSSHRDLVRRWLDALLHVDDTPERTAAAFALGVFFGFSPFLGLHTVLGLGVRVPARLQPRRGAARRLLEPAVDHRALLRVRDDGRARR